MFPRMRSLPAIQPAFSATAKEPVERPAVRPDRLLRRWKRVDNIQSREEFHKLLRRERAHSDRNQHEFSLLVFGPADPPVALLCLSPLLLLVAIIIKAVSPGPVILKQTRIGHNGREFAMWKFRTMGQDTDGSIHQSHLDHLIHSDAPLTKLDAARDPRICRFGNIIRRSAVDELPQLINVLRGEMSLIGPRPCMPYEARAYRLWQTARFDAVPGMTGLWQVSGKNRTTFRKMMHLDIAYARQQSFWLDLRILLK